MNEPEPVPPADVPAPNPLAAFYVALIQSTPRVWVTWTLIAANVVVFVAMVVGGVNFMEPTAESLITWGADYSPRTTAGEWWRLGSAMFLHIGVIHLLMNMVVLYQAGPFVERLYGNAGFLFAYLLSGLLGSVVSIVFNPNVVSAGASGAVFGTFGLLVGYLARCRGSIPFEVSSSLFRSAGSFLGINLVYGLSRSGIDMAAHGGGLVAGFFLGLALALPLSEAGRRARRNQAVTAAGLALVALSCFLLPRSIDMRAEYEKLVEVETRVLAAYNGAIEKKASDPEWMRVLEKEIIPDWRAFAARLDAWKLSGAEGKRRVQVSAYMSARLAGWELMLQGFKAGDSEKVRAGSLKVKKAVEDLNSAIGKDN